jgi:hypothetical protein
MIVKLSIDYEPYLEYSASNALNYDSNLLENKDVYTLSAKYYGSSTCINRVGWIAFLHYEKGIVERNKKYITIEIIKNDKKIVHSLEVNVPEHYNFTTKYIEVDDSIVKKIYLRDLHRFEYPVPLEISGIEFKL